MQNEYYDDDYYDDNKPNLTFAVLVALAVHVVVALALFLSLPKKTKPEVVIMEAVMMDAKTAKAVQNQVAKANLARQKAEAKAEADAKAELRKSLSKPSSKPSPSAQANAYNERMAQREKEFQKQLAEHVRAVDEEILASAKRREEAFEAEQRERQKAVDSLRQQAQENERMAQEKYQAITEAREQERAKENENAKKSQSDTVHRSLGDVADSPSVPNVARGGQVTSTKSNQASTNQAQANIAGRVQRIWERYENPKNRHLTATIVIDDNGNLLSVSFGAGDKDLQPSLEASIRQASPFPEMKGLSNRFTIKFSTY